MLPHVYPFAPPPRGFAFMLPSPPIYASHTRGALWSPPQAPPALQGHWSTHPARLPYFGYWFRFRSYLELQTSELDVLGVPGKIRKRSTISLLEEKTRSTVLHAADDPNMVEVIMDMADNKYSLLELPNDDSETPAYRAAKYGKLHVLKYLHTKYRIEAMHFPPKIYEGLQRPILHYCVLTFNFRKSLAEEKEKLIPNKNEDEHAEEEGITCLKLLSKMRMAFKSTDTRKLGLAKRLIYEYKGVRTHKFTEQLLELLLDSEDSWKQCPYVPPKEKIMFSREFPSNVTEKKDRIKLKDKAMTVKDSVKDKQTKEEWLEKALNGKNGGPRWRRWAAGAEEGDRRERKRENENENARGREKMKMKTQ
ncbi:hypothetical protein Fmac_011049 [Flemingia macrophylla]|uniref:Uncharacterized protein n=1 Tax=Flemingia macrophylla TaxID=520843 RepID=A0ABD1MM62_9FABA